MATAAQYDILRSVYVEENERYSELINRGKIYLTICSFFLGGLAFKLNETFQTESWWIKAPFLVSATSFIAAFLFIILALGIYTHEGLCDPRTVIEDFGEEPPSDGTFRDDRLADIAIATERNTGINDRRARLLSAAAFVMLFGVISGFSGIVMAVI